MFLEEKVDILAATVNAQTEAISLQIDVIKALQADVKKLLLAGTAPVPPVPSPSIKWPYGNFENSKYTFPDASEKPALDVMKGSSPFITFNADGSITFDVPAGTVGNPTENATNLRMERREFEDMALKTSYAKPESITPRDFMVKFDVLPDGKDITFTQAHGADLVVAGKKVKGTPYFKFVAGKDGIRLQPKKTQSQTEDDTPLLFVKKEDFKLGVWYRVQWYFKGLTLHAAIDGKFQTVVFTRTDPVYPKEGGYGPLPFKLTHKAVA